MLSTHLRSVIMNLQGHNSVKFESDTSGPFFFFSSNILLFHTGGGGFNQSWGCAGREDGERQGSQRSIYNDGL